MGTPLFSCGTARRRSISRSRLGCAPTSDSCFEGQIDQVGEASHLATAIGPVRNATESRTVGRPAWRSCELRLRGGRVCKATRDALQTRPGFARAKRPRSGPKVVSDFG